MKLYAKLKTVLLLTILHLNIQAHTAQQVETKPESVIVKKEKSEEQTEKKQTEEEQTENVESEQPKRTWLQTLLDSIAHAQSQMIRKNKEFRQQRSAEMNEYIDNATLHHHVKPQISKKITDNHKLQATKNNVE